MADPQKKQQSPENAWTPVDESAWKPVDETATPPSDSSAQSATPPEENGVQKWFDKTVSDDTPEERAQHGPVMNAARGFGEHVLGGVGGLFVHPIESARAASHLIDPMGPTSRNPVQAYGKGVVNDFQDNGPGVAVPHLLGDAAGAYLGGKATEGLFKAPRVVKRLLTGNLDAPIPGSSNTPRTRYTQAKDLGVNLDLADATNSPLFQGVKRVGENSLFGGHVYDATKAANTEALKGSMNNFLGDLYPGDHESGGRDIQAALQANHQALRSGAEGGFTQLADATGNKPVKAAPMVGKAATELLDPLTKMADKYPSLAPGKTMDVLGDLSGIGKKAAAKPTGFLDAPGSEFAMERKAARPQGATWSDLQRLRSATHDMTTANPDLVKSQALAPLQRMTQVLDDAMTSSSGSLTPEQEALFRRSNADWKDMKDTYDNPASPYHSAVRTDNPSSLFRGVGPKTPENARQLLTRLSPNAVESATQPDMGRAVGAVRRGTVESALKPNNEGEPNFGRFGTELHKIPADYRAELFSPEQNQKLRSMSSTGNALSKDFNPSGTSKQVQKYSEASSLFGGAPAMAATGHPWVAATMALEPLAQYPIAKLMTSPKVVDFMMSHPGPSNPFLAPAVRGGALLNSRKQPSLFEAQ